MTRHRFDLVVVGATTAGTAAAEEARSRGLEVAVLNPFPGGGVHEILWADLRQRIGSLRTALGEHESLAPICRQAARAIWRETALHDRDGLIASGRLGAETDIALFEGSARFNSPSRVDLATGEQIHASVFIIATGTEPRRPARFDFAGRTVRDSRSILRDPCAPRSVVIVGADWAGCEWAFVCSSAGSEVTLIDRRTRLLRALDADVRLAVQSSLHEMGVVIALDEELVAVNEGPDGECRVRLSSGRGEVAERLLVLAGGIGNTRDLGLAELGVHLDPLGHGLIDDHFQSSVGGILAIGAVSDPMGLAASSRIQAHLALDAALGDPTDCWMGAPWVLRSSIELGMCGLTEEACSKLAIPVVVGQSASAQAALGFPRFAKAVVGRSDGRVLGVQIAGPGASEAIHLASDSVEQSARLEDCIQLSCAADTTVELYWRALRSAFEQLRAPECPTSADGIHRLGLNSEPPLREDQHRAGHPR